MIIPAVHCEARKISYRQTKEGLVVAFCIHPSDMPDALAVAPLGQRYMLALAMIGDDEAPIEPASPNSSAIRITSDDIERALQNGEMSYTEARQAKHAAASERGKERFRNSTPMQQALIRACRLTDDLRFQQWVADQTATPATAVNAAAFLRVSCCDGRSRGLIAEDPESYQRYIALETAWKIHTGEMAEPR